MLCRRDVGVTSSATTPAKLLSGCSRRATSKFAYRCGLAFSPRTTMIWEGVRPCYHASETSKGGYRSEHAQSHVLEATNIRNTAGDKRQALLARAQEYAVQLFIPVLRTSTMALYKHPVRHAPVNTLRIILAALINNSTL